MKGIGLYLWSYSLLMGTSLGAQNIYFKGNIGVGTTTPMVIYSQTHLIETLLPTQGTFIYRGTENQHLQNLKQLSIGTLEVDNPKGLEIQQSVYIQKKLKLSEGYLSAKSHHKDSASTPEVILHFASAAILERSHNENYIKLPIALSNKTYFFFPFGSHEEQNHLFFETEAADLLIEMRYEYLLNNVKGQRAYSSPNYLKRLGLKRFKHLGRWGLKSEQDHLIQIHLRKPIYLDFNSSSSPIGLAGWNRKTKNWSLIPIASQTSDQIKTEPFNANGYSLIALCECTVPPKKYKPYGNFAISPNGDGVNELPVFKQYTKDRAGYFELYNRFGIRVLAAKWNDILNGKQHLSLPQIKTGTYFYVLRMKLPNQREQGYIYVKK